MAWTCCIVCRGRPGCETRSGDGMKAQVYAALTPLLGLPIRAAERTGDLVLLQIGEQRTITNGNGGQREVGRYALHLACPWRFLDGERLLAGSGDLLTPA